MAITVFTNGCFDILHAGHVDFLERAAALGDRLVVGLNSDNSVRGIKGPDRPINDQESRMRVLLGLKAVDEVVVFDEPTPERLIKELAPDVLVKGGDWQESQIVGAEFVKSRGGKVCSLPLFGGHSTTGLVSRLTGRKEAKDAPSSASIAGTSVHEHLEVFGRIQAACLTSIESSGAAIVECLRKGNKILLCGNGGSAADAQHIAAEMIGRFERERKALPAIALTTDTSALTAISNDYDFKEVYARQVEALANTGDVLVCISTSGNSPNIVAAAMAARQLGCVTIALSGATGTKLASVCDHAVLAPSARTARIQETHITIGHIWCEMVDMDFS